MIQQWRKSAPSIPLVLWRPFARMHTLKNLSRFLLHAWDPFTRLLDKYSTSIVSRIVSLKVLQIPFYLFCVAPIQTQPFHQNFHRKLFCGLAWPRVNPGIIIWNTHLVHALVCLITPSFLHGFQPNFYEYFSYACSIRQTTFSIEQTPQSIWEVLLHCMLPIVSITWTLSNHCRYSTYIYILMFPKSLKNCDT